MLVDHLGFSCLESYDKYMPVCIPYVVAAAAAAASATVEPWETYYGIYPTGTLISNHYIFLSILHLYLE